MLEHEFYDPTPSPLPGPLAGVRVLDVTTSWSGPMCCCVLADFGADVIKLEIEPGDATRRVPPFLPDTDPPLSVGQATVNRNKRSLTLDLRLAEGKEVFFDLVRGADVVVENFTAGTMDGWGLGYADVRAVKRDIVYCSITGYGQWGPDYLQVAYDPLVQARAGFVWANGEVDGGSVKSPTFLADDIAGLHGALGVLGALWHRQATGEGQHLDVAMLDTMLFQSSGLPTIGAIGAGRRWGNEFAVGAPAKLFQCKDGQINCAVLLDTQWRSLVSVIGGEIADDPDYNSILGRIARRDQCHAYVAEWAARHTVDEACQLLRAVDVPVAPVRTYAETAADPHVRARGAMQDIVQADGSVQPIVGPPVKFSRTRTSIRRPAAPLGADSDEVLTELGYSAERIAALRASGAV